MTDQRDTPHHEGKEDNYLFHLCDSYISQIPVVFSLLAKISDILVMPAMLYFWYEEEGTSIPPHCLLYLPLNLNISHASESITMSTYVLLNCLYMENFKHT